MKKRFFQSVLVAMVCSFSVTLFSDRMNVNGNFGEVEWMDHDARSIATALLNVAQTMPLDILGSMTVISVQRQFVAQGEGQGFTNYYIEIMENGFDTYGSLYLITISQMSLKTDGKYRNLFALTGSEYYPGVHRVSFAGGVEMSQDAHEMAQILLDNMAQMIPVKNGPMENVVRNIRKISLSESMSQFQIMGMKRMDFGYDMGGFHININRKMIASGPLAEYEVTIPLNTESDPSTHLPFASPM